MTELSTTWERQTATLSRRYGHPARLADHSRRAQIERDLFARLPFAPDDPEAEVAKPWP